MDFAIRDAVPADFEYILGLNEKDVVVLSPMDEAKAEYFRETAELFQGALSPADAAEKTERLLPVLAETAAAVLRENGMDYGASATLSREYFNTRAYGDATLPAGSYLALRVVLGEGKGHNWWCVMFPPLCIPAVSEPPAEAVFSPEGLQVVSPAPRFQVRFRLVEIYEEIREQIRERKDREK